MAPPPSWIDELLALPDLPAQQQFLRDHAHLLDDAAADALKEQADHYLRSDVQRSLRVADVLQYAGALIDNPTYSALGLIAEGNARSMGGLGEYDQAIELYNRAASICQTDDRPVIWARAQLGKIFSLGYLSRFDEALAAGEEARRVLERFEEWLLLGRLLGNLAIVHARMDKDSAALTLLTQARDAFRRAGPEGQLALALNEPNRAAFLCNLGRFQESIQVSEAAAEMLLQLGHTVAAARAQLNVGLTLYALERYNEALIRLDAARNVFLEDGRPRDAMKAELFTTDCLVHLRRFADVLAKCREIRETFAELGTELEVALATVNEATAYMGLGRHDAARASLAEARRLFSAHGNSPRVAIVDLLTAAVLRDEGHLERGLALAESCANLFVEFQMPVETAEAYLTAGRAALALDQQERARDFARHALHIGSTKQIPSLQYQAHHLLATSLRAQGELEEALTRYECGIEQLELLRSRLMVEFRADFVADKQAIYEDIVDLALDLDRPRHALEYAERAKSRALLDILAYRIDLSLTARDAADQPLIDELQRLQGERNRLYRRWEGRHAVAVRGWTPASEGQPVHQDVLNLEKRITDLWHKLLVRNANYARDAALWQVRAEQVHDYLAPDTIVLEYFTTHDKLIAFLITGEGVHAHRMPWDRDEVEHLIKVLWRNFALVQRSTPDQLPTLTLHARRILQDLHTLLLAPVAEHLEGHSHIIIVPHRSLHYVPFQALHNGQSYLLERQTISYLPNSSLLRHLNGGAARPSSGAWAFGHAQNGQLPHAREEVHVVAAVLNGQVAVDNDATLARLREAAGDCHVLHLATHAMFHMDNPLFSGLALAGGEWLTTLDVFNLPLSASLVTLSACQTGQHVIGGGDELLGLMRAFLYAGAASLVLTQWAVEDRSTLRLMETFYRELHAGQPKAAALRTAQLSFLCSEQSDHEATSPAHAHPYFWGPFYLVGDAGPLNRNPSQPVPESAAAAHLLLPK